MARLKIKVLQAAYLGKINDYLAESDKQWKNQ